MARNAPTRLLKLEVKLQGELEEVLKHEELLWFQQLRDEWITSDDLNTNFYHALLVAKRGRNGFSMLQNSEGECINDHDVLGSMV